MTVTTLPTHTVRQLPLSAYEHELLSLNSDGTHPPVTYPRQMPPLEVLLVWIDEHNEVQAGRTRYVYPQGETVYVSASPFPGAWTPVRLDRVLAVRSLDVI